VALLVLVVLLAGAAGWYGYQWKQRHDRDQGRAAAVAAARQGVQNFISISAQTVDRDVERVVAWSTGDFKEQYTNGIPQVKKVILDNGSTSKGEVLEAGLVSADRDSAVVLVVADATVTTKAQPKGQGRHFRIQVSMARQGGRWRIAELKFVG